MPIYPKSAAWKVRAAVLDEDQRALAKAYADAWNPSKVVAIFDDLDLASELRSLQYRSGKWETPAAWGKVMAVVCPHYNDFDAAKVATWLKGFKGIEVQAAREYSVCLYVRGKLDVLGHVEGDAHLVKAQEHSRQPDGTVRLWWD